MNNRTREQKFKDLMGEYEHIIFEGVEPPDPYEFMKASEPAKRAALMHVEIKRERSIKFGRVVAIAASVIVVISLTFGLFPAARAFAHRIGLQIIALFTSETKTIEYGLVDPDLVLVNQTIVENTGLIESEYLFTGDVRVYMIQDELKGEGPTITTEQGIVGTIEVRGNVMDYYKDSDGFVGILEIENTMIMLTVVTESESIFLTIAQSLQAIQN